MINIPLFLIGMGTITITGKRAGDDLLFIIEDDGVGMDDARLDALRKSIKVKNDLKDSFGLYNVEQRILLTYGEPYGLSFSSKVGEGTTVKILIPAMVTPPSGRKSPVSENILS